jgi:hypothetical protein
MYLSNKLFALLFIVCALAARAKAACTGTSNAAIPYSVSSTRTGDGSSTTFAVLICDSGCQDGALCSGLSSVSIGATGADGGDGKDDCGLTYNVKLTPGEGSCATVYMSAKKAEASISDVCPDGCHVKFNLADGQSVVKTIDGAAVDTASVVPEQSPAAVVEESPATVMEQSPAAVAEESPADVTGESPADVVGESPAAISSTPSPYGRRRMRQIEGALGGRRLRQYGGARRLNQYGSRRLSQYGA